MNSVQIEGDKVSVDIQAKYAGGIAGRFETSSNVSFSSIQIEGSVKGSDYTGGLFGYAINVSMTNCVVTASNINATGGTAYGCIVGYAQGCNITADVPSTSNPGAKVVNAGAVVGQMKNGSLTVNSGSNITFDGKGSTNVGAYVGYLDSGKVDVKASNLFLHVTGGGASYVGGFIGYNSGELSCSASTLGVNVSGGANAGGLCGYANQTIDGRFALYSYVRGSSVSAGEHASGSNTLLATGAYPLAMPYRRHTAPCLVRISPGARL